MSVTFSNGETCHFDVVLDNNNVQDKFLLMIKVYQDGKDEWTTSCYEDEVSDTANFIASCVVGENFQTSDLTSVASLLYMIVYQVRRRIGENDA